MASGILHSLNASTSNVEEQISNAWKSPMLDWRTAMHAPVQSPTRFPEHLPHSTMNIECENGVVKGFSQAGTRGSWMARESDLWKLERRRLNAQADK